MALIYFVQNITIHFYYKSNLRIGGKNPINSPFPYLRSMNLKAARSILSDQLLMEHSRANSEYIRDFVGTDKTKMQALIDLITGDDLILHQRGFYAMSIIGDDHPELLLPHLKVLFKVLKNPSHDGYGRAFIRYLSQIEIPKKWQGIAVDYCFTALENPKTPIAIQAHGMSVLMNIGRKETAILPELAEILNANYENSSPGYKSRAKRILKEINAIRLEGGIEMIFE